jgi:hypothetical protein
MQQRGGVTETCLNEQEVSWLSSSDWETSFCAAEPRTLAVGSAQSSRGARRVAGHQRQHHRQTFDSPTHSHLWSPRPYIAMDEPPRKRRKTSSPVPPPSSPLRKPPRRPSFASPTKASLARNYPNLLPTRTSPRQDTHARGQQTLELSVDGAGPSPKDVEASSKRPPRAFGALRRSPLAEAPSVQQNQLIRPAEEALDTEGQEKGTEKPPLDPVLEKKKQERARLQREVEELEAHVSRCTDEIQAEQQRAADVALPHAKRADLM